MKRNYNTIQQIKAITIESYWPHLKSNIKYQMHFFIRGYKVEIAFPELKHKAFLSGRKIEEEVGLSRKQFGNLLEHIEYYLSNTKEDLRYCDIFVDTEVIREEGQEDDVSVEIGICQPQYVNRVEKSN